MRARVAPVQLVQTLHRWAGESTKPSFSTECCESCLTCNVRYSNVAGMEKRLCALEGCGIEFEPNALNQMHCTRQHATLHRVRRFRERHRHPVPPPLSPNPTDPKGPQRDDQYAEAGILLNARRRPAAAVSAADSEPRSRALAA